MSIRKVYVPELEELKKLYEKLGHEEFLEYYRNSAVFLGPSDSIQFIRDAFEKKNK